MTSFPPLRPGTAIAPGYEVIAHLSRGRRLDVYDAWDAKRGTRCVVKALRPERLGDERARDALLAEGRLLRDLAHPHLVRGYELLERPEPVIVMETLGGQTLAHMLETDGPLGSADVAQLGLQLGSVVRYLHANGVLHLDLKPSNVVAEAGRAKLIDLSVARPPGPGRAGIGTWCYMAPEQACGGSLGPAADVWGVGAVLFEAATGKRPFERATLGTSEGDELTDDEPTDWDETTGSSGWTDTDASFDADELERPRLRAEALDDVPGGLAEVIRSALAEDPRGRPSVVAMMASLESLTGLPRSEWRWRDAADVDSVRV